MVNVMIIPSWHFWVVTRGIRVPLSYWLLGDSHYYCHQMASSFCLQSQYSVKSL